MREILTIKISVEVVYLWHFFGPTRQLASYVIEHVERFLQCRWALRELGVSFENTFSFTSVRSVVCSLDTCILYSVLALRISVIRVFRILY